MELQNMRTSNANAICHNNGVLGNVKNIYRPELNEYLSDKQIFDIQNGFIFLVRCVPML